MVHRTKPPVGQKVKNIDTPQKNLQVGLVARILNDYLERHVPGPQPQIFTLLLEIFLKSFFDVIEIH